MLRDVAMNLFAVLAALGVLSLLSLARFLWDERLACPLRARAKLAGSMFLYRLGLMLIFLAAIAMDHLAPGARGAWLPLCWAALAAGAALAAIGEFGTVTLTADAWGSQRLARWSWALVLAAAAAASLAEWLWQ